jgi:hypothetical protein
MAAVIQKCDFATNKTRKEIRSITNNTKLSVWLTNFRRHSKWRHKRSRIGLLHKKPIYRRHPINLNNNITDISQKKDLPTSANDTKSIAYLCDTTTMWQNCLFGSHIAFHKKQFYTRCTQNLLNDTQHSHLINQSCLFKGKKHNASEFKKLIKQRSSRRKSAPLTSVTKPSHSFPDLSLLNFWTWMDK